MKPMKSRRKAPLESDLIKEVIVPYLKAMGYTIVHKTHGNRYQKGMPDLYCFMPREVTGDAHQHRWLEAKRPRGKLTPKQVALFTRWSLAGLSVEVVTVREKLSGSIVEFCPWDSWVG